jgi:hypothetical protein
LLRKKEQDFIDRMIVSGLPINIAKMNAKFKLMIRPFTTIGVVSLEIMSWLEDEVFPAAAEMTFGSGIEPPRVSRRLFGLSYAAISMASCIA